jgi:hypothetical protein
MPIVRCIAFTACLFVLSGCVAYRGNRIPRIDPTTIAGAPNGTEITYTIDVKSQVGNDDAITTKVTRQFLSTFAETGVQLKEAAPQPRTANMNVVFEANGSEGAQIASGFVSGFTMGLIPAYARVDLVLMAQVTDAGGRVHRYDYGDTFTAWIELFLLPVTPWYWPATVEDDLIADITRSLARDMKRDGVLSTPPTGSH